MESAQRVPAVPLDLLFQSWQATMAGELIAVMELRFDRRLDADRLERACGLLLVAEPILACRLVLADPAPYWETIPEVERRRVLSVAADAEEYARVRHRGLDATGNVQVEACLLSEEAADRLLVKITHQVGDGGGIHHVVSRLSAIYTRLETDPHYRPDIRDQASRDFLHLMPDVPRAAIVWNFVRFMAPRWLPLRTHALPLPADSLLPWGFVTRSLPASRVSFLAAYGKQRGATLNDLFLAATYRAMAAEGRWDGRAGLRVSITVDLRRYLPQGRGDGVANLSSFDCPFLIRNLGHTLDETLANVTSLMRRRKKGWLGVAGLLLTDYAMRHEGYHKRVSRTLERSAAGKRISTPLLTLTNAGQIEAARITFGDQAPARARVLPPFRKLPGVLLCLSGYQGALTLSAGTPSNAHAIVGHFLDALLDELPAGDRRDGPDQEAAPA